MYVKVVTLRYEERLQGFPEGALREAAAGREVLEVRDHFFLHGGVPHLALVLLLGDGAGEGGYRSHNPNAPDPEESIAEERRPLYRELKRWRNERAKADGKPAYAIARNAQLAEIVNRAPKSLEGLKAVEGIGEGFCRDYGAEVLELVRNLPVPFSDGGTASTPSDPGGPSGTGPSTGFGGPTSASATGVPPA